MPSTVEKLNLPAGPYQWRNPSPVKCEPVPLTPIIVPQRSEDGDLREAIVGAVEVRADGTLVTYTPLDASRKLSSSGMTYGLGNLLASYGAMPDLTIAGRSVNKWRVTVQVMESAKADKPAMSEADKARERVVKRALKQADNAGVPRTTAAGEEVRVNVVNRALRLAGHDDNFTREELLDR